MQIVVNFLNQVAFSVHRISASEAFSTEFYTAGGYSAIAGNLGSRQIHPSTSSAVEREQPVYHNPTGRYASIRHSGSNDLEGLLPSYSSEQSMLQHQEMLTSIPSNHITSQTHVPTASLMSNASSQPAFRHTAAAHYPNAVHSSAGLAFGYPSTVTPAPSTAAAANTRFALPPPMSRGTAPTVPTTGQCLASVNVD